jgi:hypothetical protein
MGPMSRIIELKEIIVAASGCTDKTVKKVKKTTKRV